MTVQHKATLTFSDGTAPIEFPVYKGTVGPDVIDIRKLYGQTGKFTFDPGFMSTAACDSKITYIDGDKGELLYRGYPIEQIAQHCDYLQTCYLLLNGELPDDEQRADFVHRVTHHTMVHEQMARFLQGFRRDAHPMAVLVGMVGALSAFYHDSLDINDPEHRFVSAIRLIAKMPTLVALAYKYSMGQPSMYPQNHLSYSANFMRMMFATPCEEYRPNDVLVRALDRILILHADHEQNASTSTVRLAGSSGANPFACIAAGIATLWGPAHGGANEACLVMLNDIQKMGGVAKIGEFIDQVKDKNSGVKLMGFGHRVYKNYDPRAKLMRETCHEVLERARPARRSAVRAGDEAREDRARGRLLRQPQALPERRLLFGHRAEGARHPDRDVHLRVRAGSHRRLDRAVGRDDLRSRAEDRPAAPAVHRARAARRQAARQTLTGQGRLAAGRQAALAQRPVDPLEHRAARAQRDLVEAVQRSARRAEPVVQLAGVGVDEQQAGDDLALRFVRHAPGSSRRAGRSGRTRSRACAAAASIRRAARCRWLRRARSRQRSPLRGGMKSIRLTASLCSRT